MELVPAGHADLAFLASLRNDEASVRHSKRGRLSLEAIEEDYLENPEKRAYVVRDAQGPLGYAIFESLAVGRVEISIALAPERRGEGLGVGLVRAATTHALADGEIHAVVAVVLDGNEASAKTFERAGYRRERRIENGWSLVADASVGDG